MKKKLIFEKNVAGRRGFSFSKDDVPRYLWEDFLPAELKRKEKLYFPQLSELDVVRHYSRLAEMNFSVDKNFYPLGSCTMKYNPKMNELAAEERGFSQLHPYQEEEDVQGMLELLYLLEKVLVEITGMERFSFQPAAGAAGELSGMLMIKKFFLQRKDFLRQEVIVPDSSHGTNPASAALAGFKVVTIKSNQEGLVDIDALSRICGSRTAALMLTNPNTLGLFEEKIWDMAEIVHKQGGLLYYDGANLNPLLGKVRISDMGFDIMHINLHKTFATPHGGGGPGGGPVGARGKLKEFLPLPLIGKSQDRFYLEYKLPNSIGRVRSFYGNIPVMVKAFAYLLRLGKEGLLRVAEHAVLNANYLKEKLKNYYEPATDKPCWHEVVFAGLKNKTTNVRTFDIAKRLIDYGVHPPTVYFPLIVKEALMIEPTETESKQILDEFAGVMEAIAKEAVNNPQLVKEAPHTTPVGRLDEAKAARQPQLRWVPPSA